MQTKKLSYQNQLEQHLEIKCCLPKNSNGESIVFFFGGAWKEGSNLQFMPQAEFFTNHGYTVFLPDYRITNRDKSNPIDSLQDSICAWVYINKYVKDNNLNIDEIYLSGGSAGGQLALMSAFKSKIKPSKFILFNPVTDMTMPPIKEALGVFANQVSSIHMYTDKASPMLIIHGTKDDMVSHTYSETFAKKMRENGTDCEVLLFEDKNHGFFNQYVSQTDFEITNGKMLDFIKFTN